MKINKYITLREPFVETFSKISYREKVVPVWWVRFLTWLFEDRWLELKRELTRTIEENSRDEVRAQMKSYAYYVDSEIIKLVDIAEPAFKLKDFDDIHVADLAPEPNIINGIAYPKRIVKLKNIKEI